MSDSRGRDDEVGGAATGKYAMTAGADRTVRLWNPTKDGDVAGQALLIKTYEGPHGYEVLDVAM